MKEFKDLKEFDILYCIDIVNTKIKKYIVEKVFHNKDYNYSQILFKEESDTRKIHDSYAIEPRSDSTMDFWKDYIICSCKESVNKEIDYIIEDFSKIKL